MYEQVEVNSERWLNPLDLLNEEWKFIDDFDNYYQVSNYGRVKSLKLQNKEIIMKQSKSNRGYMQVLLCKNGKHKSFKVHRLVATAFLSNEENKPHVNHINGIKNDNRCFNLEWITNSENQKHAFKIGLNKPRLGKENNCSRKVIQFDKSGKEIKRWDCIGEIARELNLHSSNIVACCKGKIKQSGGFIWKYDKGEI